jgi:hypothetical protein
VDEYNEMLKHFAFEPANREVTLVNGRGSFKIKSKGTMPVITDSNGFAGAPYAGGNGLQVAGSFIRGVQGTATYSKIVGESLAVAGAETVGLLTNALKGAALGADQYAGADEIAGDVVASFLVYGDVRDIVVQGYKGIVRREDVDNFTVGASIFGILTNFPTPAAALEVPVTFVKSIGKVATGKPLARLNMRLMKHMTNEMLLDSPKAAAKLAGGYVLAYGIILGSESETAQGVVIKVVQFANELQQMGDEDD